MTTDERDGAWGARAYEVVEPARTPLLGLVLGYAAMAPFVLGAGFAWILPQGEAALATRLTLLWGGGILAFLAGVRRGLSFRAPGGETVPAVVSSLFLFALAFLALVLEPGRVSFVPLLVGYAALAVFDTIAGKQGDAPPFFARLRPPQMLLALAGLAALLARSSHG